MDRCVTKDNGVEGTDKTRLKWQRIRWLWFALATLGLLGTPSAVLSAVEVCRADHRMIWIFILAFSLRLGLIGLLYQVWWRYRPRTE